MVEKDNNTFKFSLYQENLLLCERIFSADCYNPQARLSVNIRDILPKAMVRLQKVLSKKNYCTTIDVGDNKEYDLYEYQQKLIDSYPKHIRESLKYDPQNMVLHVDDLTIRGVECKIGLYYNNKPVVERVFYVMGFNPVARWSTNVLDVVNDIAYQIESRIIESDTKYEWDCYDRGTYHRNQI
jgi:hypothetical protein